MVAVNILEGRSKKLDDALHLYRKNLKLSKAGFSSPRKLTPKDYLRCNAYICWKERVLDTDGCRYEAFFAARRFERGLEATGREVRPFDRDIDRVLGCQSDLMLVRHIEAADGEKYGVSVLVGLNFAADCGSHLASARADHLTFDLTVKFPSGPDGWEIATSMIPTVGYGAGGDQMIKCASEIVNCVPEDEWKGCGKRRAVPNRYTCEARRWVHIEEGQVRIASKMIVGHSLEISDVGFCAI